MAKLSTKNATLLAELFNPMTGRAKAVRSDGKILYRSPFSNGWKLLGTLKPGITPDSHINKQKAKGYRTLQRGDIPTLETITRMERDGVASCTDGCTDIEPDSCCEHGAPAWPQAIVLGFRHM